MSNKADKSVLKRKIWTAPQILSLDDEMSDVEVGLGMAPEGLIAGSAPSS